MINTSLKTILVCPRCLSDIQVLRSTISCPSCHLEGRVINGKPQLIASERVKSLGSTKKVDGAKLGLTLDIGAGSRSTGSINLDIRPLENIDVVANALYLPFADQSIYRVLLNQVIEHFDHEQAKWLICELSRIVCPNGVIEFWTPNFQSIGILATWLFGRVDWSNKQAPSIYSTLTGMQEYPENVHKSYWTASLLKYYLERSDLYVEEVSTDQRFASRFSPGWIIRYLFPKRRGQLYARARQLPESGVSVELEKVEPTDPWTGYRFS